MGKVIILEGPDGGGKTTLANQLVEFGFEYQHEGPPPKGVDLVAHYLQKLNKSLESRRDVVHDRLWLGERIYGPIVRGADGIGRDGQDMFMRLHNSKHIHQFICIPTIMDAQANYAKKILEKEDYMKSMENWVKVFKGYARWLYEFGTIGNIYDYGANSVNDVLDVLTYAKPTLPTGTIGNPSAKHLFVGDKPNHLTIDVPFFSLNGSSGYLNSAIKLAGIKESDVVMSNAFSPIGVSHNLGDIKQNLKRLDSVFLMGKVAEEWYDSSVIPDERRCRVFRLPHPSFLKRFRGHNPDVMAKLIVEALNGTVNPG